MINPIRGATGEVTYSAKSTVREGNKTEDATSVASALQQHLLLPDTVSISETAESVAGQAAASPSDQEEAIQPNFVPAGEPSPHYVTEVTLSDGEEVLQQGDIDASKSYFHKQGNNDLNFKGTCGIVSCGDVANQFGVDVTENDLVHYAADHDLCRVVDDSPAQSGGTTMTDQEQILEGVGISSHIEVGSSLEGIGRELEEGRGVIMEVNAGELWNDARYYNYGVINHAVTVTAVASNIDTGEAEGLWINDSGSGQYSRFIAADDPVIQNWIKNGSPAVVTDLEHAPASE